MKIFYEILSSSDEYSINEGEKHIWFYLEELLNNDFEESFLEEKYLAFTLIDINKTQNHFLNSLEWNSKNRCGWSKSVLFYEKKEEIDYWVGFLKKEVEKCLVYNLNSLEFLAKMKSFTSYYLESGKSGYEAYTLDAEYGLLFDNSSRELKINFSILNWEFDIDLKDRFKVFVNCQFLINKGTSAEQRIDFKILVISFEKLISEYKNNKFTPLTYIMSNHFDKDLLSDYINHTFNSFKVSSIEELMHKIATFAYGFKTEMTQKKVGKTTRFHLILK